MKNTMDKRKTIVLIPISCFFFNHFIKKKVDNSPATMDNTNSIGVIMMICFIQIYKNPHYEHIR